MHRRSLQEWADFTGWYTAISTNGEDNLYSAYRVKPEMKTQGSAVVFLTENEDDIFEIPAEFAEYEDPRRSLHEPQKTCPECKGRGHRVFEMIDDFGCNVLRDMDCGACNGTGRVKA